MNASLNQSDFSYVGALLRGELKTIVPWIEQWSTKRFLLNVGVVILGAGFYGAAMGCWRDPQQALYVAIKFPLIILLTTVGNALINSMIAPLLGLNISFQQSFSAILMSFTVAATILGSFSPLTAYIVWNTPAMSSGIATGQTYNLILLVHVLAIALAGVTGNVRLLQLLAQISGSRAISLRVLFAWLAVNLFLGSQLSWILRPFIGSPILPVDFFRQAAFHGNFYEAVFQSLRQILQSN